MKITLHPDIAAEIIRRVLNGVDHRDVVVDLIDGIFVSEAIEFFKRIVQAKIDNASITMDWYRRHFLDEGLDKGDFATNAGLNLKTIGNKRGTQRKEIIIEESLEHFEKLVQLVESLNDDSVNIDLSLSIRGVAVRLNLNESLIVINALAVKRATIRGGAWSSSGKLVEGPLMETLCRLFRVDDQYFTKSIIGDKQLREVDYYLLPPSGEQLKCEMKLMGKGNPESADAVIARGSSVFVASTLSDTNKTQLDSLRVHWTELQTKNGFLRFEKTLEAVGIPHTKLERKDDYTDEIDRAVRAVFEK